MLGASTGTGAPGALVGSGISDHKNVQVFPAECLFGLLTNHAVGPALAGEHKWRAARFARLLEEAPALWPEVLRRTLAAVGLRTTTPPPAPRPPPKRV